MTNHIGIQKINEIDVFIIDYTNLSNSQLVDAVFETINRLKGIDQPQNFLIDISNTNMGQEVMGNLRQAGKKIQPFVKKSAIVGLESKLRPIFNVYLRATRSKMHICKDRKEALAYLNFD
jgi:hypothetical protein